MIGGDDTCIHDQLGCYHYRDVKVPTYSLISTNLHLAFTCSINKHYTRVYATHTVFQLKHTLHHCTCQSVHQVLVHTNTIMSCVGVCTY